MINFRYHVVSLVSVFLALAVGIVLGAGPLKEPIETGLADQVSALRQDKDDLRSQLSDQEAISEYTAEVLEGLEGRALTSLLPGEAVLLVQLGDGQGDRMEALRAGVNRAGAKVAGQIRLEDNWAQADRLAQAGEALDGLLGVGYFGFGLDYQSKVFSALELVLAGPRVEATGDGSQWFPEVEEGGAGDADGEAADGDQGTGDGSDQAADGAGPADGDQGTGGEQTGDAGDGAGTAGDGDQTGPDQTAGPEDPDEPSAEPTGVATVAPSGTSRPSASPTPAEPDGRRADQTVLAAVWDALTDAGVFSGEQPGATTAVVLLSGAYDAGLSEEDALVEAERQAALLPLVESLDAAGLALVVAGPAWLDGGLVALIRDSDTLWELVATVSSPVEAAEVVTVMWAAAADLHGSAGHYGLDAPNGRLLPPYRPVVLPTASPSPTPSASSTPTASSSPSASLGAEEEVGQEPGDGTPSVQGPTESASAGATGGPSGSASGSPTASASAGAGQ